MVAKQYQMVWTKRSQQDIRAAYNYISQYSMQNAAKVVNDIIAAAEKALHNPAYYGRDKYKTENDGSYRAFEKHKYRIVYRYKDSIIRVLRVRHTKMEPKTY